MPRDIRRYQHGPDDEDDVWVISGGDPQAPAVVTFGGINTGVGMPPFEFLRVLDTVGVRGQRVIFRDRQQCWYQRGVGGLGPNALATAASLKALTVGAVRTVMIGNSAGGYAAMLFGALTNASTVLAFAPQTFFDPARKLAHGDRRWLRQTTRATVASLKLSNPSLVAALDEHLPDIHVHVDPQHRLDTVHCRWLAERVDLQVHKHAGHGHALIAHLRDTGELHRILSVATT